MRNVSIIFVLIIYLCVLGCVSEPKENPDGKYGADVAMQKNTPLAEILNNQGLFLNREVVVSGRLSGLSEQLSISTFTLIAGNDNLKCTFEDIKLPKSLEGKGVAVMGTLTIVQISSESGRQPGGEHTFAADPSGASYKDELRLKVKGLQVMVAEQ